jgi:hypothetical protein
VSLLEGTKILLINSRGEKHLCSQILNGRAVYWSERETGMRFFPSKQDPAPRGFRTEYVCRIADEGVEELDLFMPRSVRRCKVYDLLMAPVRNVRGEIQHFLGKSKWKYVSVYDKPHHDTCSAEIEIQEDEE